MRKVLLVTLAVWLAACSPAAETPAPAETAAAPFPVTVTGTDGRSITLDDPPARIVSLSATHTEMLYAIGASSQIAGTDLTSNYPPEAAGTAKVDAFNFNVEEVAALEPDLVILAFDSFGEVPALERVSISALVLGPARDIEDMEEQIMLLGRATGHEDEALALSENVTARLQAAFGSVPDTPDPLTFYHEIDATLFSANSATFLGDLFSRFGLVNIADQVPDELGSGFVQLSPEFILSEDPKLIFLGDAAFGESIETLAARPGWDTLSAVKGGKVYPLDADISGRWGPRTAELAEAIGAAVTGASS